MIKVRPAGERGSGEGGSEVMTEVGVKENSGVVAVERTVAGVVNSVETFEGAGFLVRRPFPKPALQMFDPFLLLDEMGPVDLAPGGAKGAPDHPHRGFETRSEEHTSELPSRPYL